MRTVIYIFSLLISNAFARYDPSISYKDDESTFGTSHPHSEHPLTMVKDLEKYEWSITFYKNNSVGNITESRKFNEKCLKIKFLRNENFLVYNLLSKTFIYGYYVYQDLDNYMTYIEDFKSKKMFCKKYSDYKTTQQDLRNTAQLGYAVDLIKTDHENYMKFCKKPEVSDPGKENTDEIYVLEKLHYYYLESLNTTGYQFNQFNDNETQTVFIHKDKNYYTCLKYYNSDFDGCHLGSFTPNLIIQTKLLFILLFLQTLF